jgi:hypothetical protein
LSKYHDYLFDKVAQLKWFEQEFHSVLSRNGIPFHTNYEAAGIDLHRDLGLVDEIHKPAECTKC